MFDITKRTNLSNLWNYYRKGFSPNAETLRAPEATGALAAEFGLQGPISAEAFHSLFSGNVPGTTHSFWPKRPKVICIDTCYSPHKSVSLYGIFDQRVRECVWSALRCEDVERFGQCRAWTSPSKIRNQPPTSPIVAEKSQRLPAAPSEGLLGIKFLHNDSLWSRGTNLHTHMPIVSLVARPDQPGYRCLEPSSIFENKRFLGACADSRLHANLLSIGCPAVASKRGPIIAGFKPEWISLFATGNAAILLE